MYRRFKTTVSDKNGIASLEKQQDIAHGSYGALLFDKRWKNRREYILNKDKYSCTVCSSQQDLQVHHRQYHYLKTEKKFKVPWDYPDQLLITLCERCHQKGHNQYKVPIIYL